MNFKSQPIIRVRGLRNQFGEQVVHEDLDLDVRAVVDQRRKADQHLAAAPHFHQLGQRTEGPGGVALRLGRRGGGADVTTAEPN